MGNISSGMETICKDIVSGHEDRKKSLHDVQKDVKEIKAQAGTIRDDAKKFIGDCKESHKEMAKNLKGSLSKNREDLNKDVGLLRKDFQKSQKAVRQDIEGAGKSWNEMHKTLMEKKTK